MKSGDIFELKYSMLSQIIKERNRVLCCDQYEVFYDHFYESDNSWTFANNLGKKNFFYRMPLEAYLTKSKKLGFEKLTEAETQVFRPDLLLRIGRFQNISWNDKILKSEKTLRTFFQKNQTLNFKERLNVNEIWLYPTGAKKGIKRGEIIKSNNGKFFSLIELLVKANQVQSKINPNKSKGIGIYRIGIQKKIPSFYIGDFFDLAGVMKNVFEKNN